MNESYAFAPTFAARRQLLQTSLNAAEKEETAEAVAAPLVSGEQLEVLLTDWETPLVVDAFATWCGPCLMMGPEFEAAAKELKGRVRFVKLDTDVEEEMANRLNIMGLPTLLYLDKNEADDGTSPNAVLKTRIEGALQKDSIIALCEHHFFGGPMPEKL
eukprot:CAMPEP_0118703686 /NCGR_PEP_ID=MMETSP0800-20121206/18724_1 /TAXON_ID=210618 ORGANISM="Striatella unipunctata, Strain CCMP2910" /NCGR_SAMPLE_ID=MMETSP0800 /ASSEMBLY_ACC=CAM_ASM_000638 /LENGTH=158 /DNA_ID=CAMNT_0006605305 /DNA_START=83 /DNA_END=559 /DNA_ORIENTATION=-